VFAHIYGGVVTEVGPLPFSARRQDTNQLVHDLPGVNRVWRKACGWYDLDDLAAMDLSELQATDEQREAIRSAIEDAGAARDRRRDVLQRVEQAIGLIRDIGWDYIDRWAEPTILPGGTIPGSPDAGIEWGPLTAAQKAEALRRMSTLTILWGIRTAEALVLVKQVLADLIDAADFDPPDPR
jgi:hypothetical protein